MARFRFFMVGMADAPVLEVGACNLSELNEAVSRQKFLEAQMVEIDGYGANCGVLVPTGRIQMISEVDF